MEWLNIHTSILDSEEFVGSAPTDRATWLCLLRYCAGQENGGLIRECADWTDRKWQQLCRITRKEVQVQCTLWSWTDSGDLAVQFYPLEREQDLRAMRDAGRKGNAMRWGTRLPPQRNNQSPRESPPDTPPDTHPDSPPESPPVSITERNGKEGNRNRKGTRARGMPVDNFARHPISDYPDLFRPESDPIDLAINLTGDQQPMSIGGWRKQLARIGEKAFREILAEFWGEGKVSTFRNPGAVLSAKLNAAGVKS